MALGPSPYAALKPSERDLDFVAGEAGGNWRSLLTHLGIKFPEIQRLFSKNDKDSRVACFEGLFTWLSSEVNNPEEPVTFGTLFQALREAKMASCASLLEEKLEARCGHKPATGGDLSAQPGTSKSKENPAMANSSSKDHNTAENQPTMQPSTTPVEDQRTLALRETDSLDCVQHVLQGLHEELQRHLVVDKSLACRMYGWKPRPLIGRGEMAQINSQVYRGLPMDAFRTWYEHAYSNYTTEYLQEFCKCLRCESKEAKPRLAQVADLITKEIGRGVGEGSPSTTQARHSARDPRVAEQLHRQECTQGPPAPRTGMDEKIGCSLDILRVSQYRMGLIGEMKLLGSVLGIGEDTTAILRRHGSLDDHLVEILDLYIKQKTPTWKDFCKALKRLESFNKVRTKIEADHDIYLVETHSVY